MGREIILEQINFYSSIHCDHIHAKVASETKYAQVALLFKSKNIDKYARISAKFFQESWLNFIQLLKHWYLCCESSLLLLLCHFHTSSSVDVYLYFVLPFHLVLNRWQSLKVEEMRYKVLSYIKTKIQSYNKGYVSVIYFNGYHITSKKNYLL